MGQNISFCFEFCELLVNITEFLEDCHFFVIYRSGSCKGKDNRELTGQKEQ